MFCLFVKAKGTSAAATLPEVCYHDVLCHKCKCVDIFEYEALLHGESHRWYYKHS